MPKGWVLIKNFSFLDIQKLIFEVKSEICLFICFFKIEEMEEKGK